MERLVREVSIKRVIEPTVLQSNPSFAQLCPGQQRKQGRCTGAYYYLRHRGQWYQPSLRVRQLLSFLQLHYTPMVMSLQQGSPLFPLLQAPKTSRCAKHVKECGNNKKEQKINKTKKH